MRHVSNRTVVCPCATKPMAPHQWPSSVSRAQPAFDWDDDLDSLRYDPSLLDCWEYSDIAVDLTSLKAVTDALNELGAQGWEVISTTAFSSVSANKLLVLAKRRLLSPAPPEDPAAGWYDDPTGRFDKRYWDGRFWSAHVGNSCPKSLEKDPPTMLRPPDMDDRHSSVCATA